MSTSTAPLEWLSSPATVDTGKIAADFKNGVLTIRLPFREEAKPRAIAIDVAG